MLNLSPLLCRALVHNTEHASTPRRRISTPKPIFPRGFLRVFTALHRELTPRQQTLSRKRAAVLARHTRAKSQTTCRRRKPRPQTGRFRLPAWCADQRNQMTGPADDAELVVKMLNSGAPGVMLDLEDSMANSWSNLTTGVANIVAALKGELTYFDAKRNTQCRYQRKQDRHFHSPARSCTSARQE